METLAVLVILTFITSAVSQVLKGPACRLDDLALLPPQNKIQRREVYLGLILPVHHHDPQTQTTCGIIDERDILHLEAFFWALNTYDERHNLTSSTPKLRGVAFDTCGSPDRFYFRMNDWIKCSPTPDVAKPNTLAFLGYDNGEVTAKGAQLFNGSRDVFVNLSPKGPMFKKTIYPKYYTLSPSVDQEADAIVAFMRQQDWREAEVIYVNDVYGKSGLASFSAKARAAGISVTSSQDIAPRADDTSIRQTLQGTDVNTPAMAVIVVFAYGKQKAIVHDALSDRFVIISSGNLDDYGRTVASNRPDILLTYHHPKVAINSWVNDFERYLADLTLNRNDVINPWFANYFRQKLKCGASGKPPCDPGLKFGKAASPSPNPTALIISAVDLMLGTYFSVTESCPYRPDCPGYDFSLLESEFQTKIHRALLDKGGLASGTHAPEDWEYTVYRSSTAGDRIVNTHIGYVKKSRSQTEVSVEPIEGVVVPGRRTVATRWDIGHGWIIAIGVLAGLGILLVIIAAAILILLYLRSIRISYVVLYAILLFGAFIGYLTLFAFIPVPTKATCGITRFGIGLAYGICISVMVVRGFLMFKKQESAFALPIFIYLSFALLVAIEVVIIVMWLILVPPDVALHIGSSFAWGCNHYTSDPWRTDFENHLLALIYIMLLIFTLLVVGLVLLKMRRRWKDRLMRIEAILILVAGVGCTLLWLAWTLIGGLLKTNRYAQEFGDGALAIGLWFILTLLVILLLVHLWFYWKKSHGRLEKHTRTTTTTSLHNSIPVITTIQNRHVIDDRHDDNVITTTAATTSTTTATTGKEIEIPIIVVDNKHGQAMEMSRVEDSKVNHTGRANGDVVATKQTKKEVHTHSDSHTLSGSHTLPGNHAHSRNQTHPRDGERYAAHMTTAKLSGATDNLGHHHHHHHHHSSSHHPNSSFYCSECGYAIDPNALHLKHPRSERSSSHNTSVYVADASGHLANGDTSFAHSDGATHAIHDHHPIYTKNPYGVYSTPTIYYSNRRPESIYSTNQRVMRISRDLTGRPPSRVGMSFSEYDRIGHQKRSFRRTKSEEQLGAL